MERPNLSISNFKLFSIKVLFPFLISILLIGSFVNYFFENNVILGNEISGAYKVNRIITVDDSTEIPFFGSSRSEETFIPDSLVSHGFNYGLSGTQDDVLLFFLKHECAKRKHTPLVINFDLDGLNYRLGDVSNYLYNIQDPGVKKLLGNEYKTMFNVPFFKYYGYFETYTKYLLNERLNLTKFTNNGAAIEEQKFKKEVFDRFVNKRLGEKNTFKNDSSLNSQLNELIMTHPDRLFIFVVTPYHSSYLKSLVNYKDAMDYLSQLAKYKNVEVLNFAGLQLPDNCFINTTHLNSQGAFVFNRLLRTELTRCFLRHGITGTLQKQ